MIYAYIIIMALVTYLIRMLPLTLFQKKIKSRFIRSFLSYVPYACLTAMTIPSIFFSTRHPASAVLGLIVAVVFAMRTKNLAVVAGFACLAVFIAELFLL